MAVQREQTAIVSYIRPELFGRMTTDAPWQGEWHRHPFSETVYITEGCFQLLTEDALCTVCAGEAVVIRPGVLHRFICTEAAELMYMGCSCIRAGSTIPLPAEAVYSLKAPPLLTALGRLAATQTLPDTVWELMHPFWQQLAAPATDSADGENALIRQIKEYLKAHLHENISVTALARTFYLTPQYLGSTFHKTSGKTVKEYHTSLRMQRAMALLKETDRSVSSIAEELGYDTPQYFSTCFRNYYGLSPRAVRNSTAKDV